MKLLSKRFIVSGTIALAIGVVLISTNGTRRVFAQTAGSTPQMSEKYFKNVTVMKGVPVDEFMGEMGLFSAALSYCCGECHVNAGTDHPDWASDAKPTKVIARQMAAMVVAINKNNFHGGTNVTCWTCHRGSPTPAKTASMDIIYGEPLSFPEDVLKAAPPGSGTPTLDQIFDKYTQALGGAAKTAAIKSFIAKGTSNLYDEAVKDPAEVFAKAPNQAASYVHQRGGDNIRSSDGTHGFVQLPQTTVKEYPLTGSLLEGGKLEAEMIAAPWGLKNYLTNWKVALPTTIDGKGVWVVQGSGNNGLVATFYFDKETGLLTRYARYVTTSYGRVPTQVDYSDYRPVAGVMMPFKWTYGWISGRDQYEISEYQPNVAIDAAKFGDPSLKK